MAAIRKLLETCPKALFQQKLREITWNPSDLSHHQQVVQILELCTHQDQKLAVKLEIPSIIPNLKLSSAISYIDRLGKIKGMRALPETYAVLEAVLRKQSDIPLRDLQRLLKHYNRVRVCPPANFTNILLTHFFSHLPEANFSQLSSVIRCISLFHPTFSPSPSQSNQVTHLWEALGKVWPTPDNLIEYCSNLVSLSHSFAMFQMTDVSLWKCTLRDIIAYKEVIQRDMQFRIAALSIKKTKKICELLMPETYASLKSVWEEVDRSYKVDFSYVRKGTEGSALEAKVMEALAHLQVQVQRNGVIEEVFPYDLLISQINVEIDGPDHFVRWTNGVVSDKLLWSYIVRDLAMQTKGFTVKRVDYRTIDKMHKEQLTMKFAALLGIEVQDRDK